MQRTFYKVIITRTRERGFGTDMFETVDRLEHQFGSLRSVKAHLWFQRYNECESEPILKDNIDHTTRVVGQIYSYVAGGIKHRHWVEIYHIVETSQEIVVKLKSSNAS